MDTIDADEASTDIIFRKQSDAVKSPTVSDVKNSWILYSYSSNTIAYDDIGVVYLGLAVDIPPYIVYRVESLNPTKYTVHLEDSPSGYSFLTVHSLVPDLKIWRDDAVAKIVFPHKRTVHVFSC